ncbi:MAG: HPr family phosphocarrier protein [Acidobacteria bacterium]|nr:HPr family phosphocarrier protein [Acidobacteriota bacterium]MBI3658421.1 HPr family phosphocarrier protein [Acidobacteriota bacterium]
MICKVFVVNNRLGLHGRAAGKFVRIASRFKSDVKLSRMGNGPTVDGKSILEILTLAARQGTSLQMMIQGKDELETLEALRSLVDSNFGET